MKELNLDGNVTLVCQDWGGLVGLSVVKESPEVFSNLVIMNTGLPIGEDQAICPPFICFANIQIFLQLPKAVLNQTDIG